MRREKQAGSVSTRRRIAFRCRSSRAPAGTCRSSESRRARRARSSGLGWWTSAPLAAPADVRASFREAEDAAAGGRAIARAGAGLVYGGGRVGLMGILADAALEEGAPVYGVIPAGLAEREIAHGGLTHLEVVATMHERKARMSEVAVGFLALAGGFGTLDEFFEIVTWRQLVHHPRPIGLCNGPAYFHPLLPAL